MQGLLYDYYGWDPYWGASHFGGAILPNAESEIVRDAARRAAEAETPPLDGADHLHSVAEFKGSTFTPTTATSGMSRTCSPTTPIGRSAIS